MKLTYSRPYLFRHLLSVLIAALTLSLALPCFAKTKFSQMEPKAELSDREVTEIPVAPTNLIHTQIELRTNVALKRSEVTLNDIAWIVSRDLPTLKRLMALPLGHAPRIGQSSILDRETLARWIQLRTRIDSSQITWAGSSATELYSATQSLYGEEVVDVATRELQAWLNKRSQRAEVTAGGIPRDITLPIGRVELKVRPLPESSALAKRMSVWVDAWVNKRYVRTIPISFEISAWGPRYIATHDLISGTSLEPSNVVLREVEISGLSPKQMYLPMGEKNSNDVLSPAVNLSDASTNFTTFTNFRLRRSISAGEALTRNHLEPKPSVSRGDWVTLRSNEGLVDLESRVEVLQDGKNGQTIRVKLSNANSPILAKVAGPGLVEVQ